MRVIITGGSGLIGRALAADLARNSYETIIISRRPERIFGLPAGVRVERWDGRNTEGWYSVADGADVIVNLAGENIALRRWTDERKRIILQSRLNAGQAVVEAVKRATKKPYVVIQASAVGYYGARYYDPTIGRFISADVIVQSLANPQSLNRYSYVLNNPLTYFDPNGMYYVAEGWYDSSDPMDQFALFEGGLIDPVEYAYQEIKRDEDVPDWIKEYMTEIHDSDRPVYVSFDDLNGEAYALSAMDFGSGLTTRDQIVMDWGYMYDPAILAHESYHIFEGNPGSTIQEEFIAYTAQYFVAGSFPDPWFNLPGGLGSDEFLVGVRSQLMGRPGKAANVYQVMPLRQSQMTRQKLALQMAVALGAPPSDSTTAARYLVYLSTIQVRGIPWN